MLIISIKIHTLMPPYQMPVLFGKYYSPLQEVLQYFSESTGVPSRED